MKMTLVNTFFGKSEYVTPPLGIAYLASSLRKKNIDVEIIDAQALKLESKKLVKTIARSNPDFVGFTALTPTFQNVANIARLVKENIGCKTILGGPHATILKDKILREHKEFDYCIAGEGEEALPKLLLYGLENIGDINYIENLDDLPFPARDLLPNSHYYHPLTNRKPFTTMITSRGCPYNCLYCCKAVVGYKYRTRSPDNIIREIEELINEFGIKEIIFHDDIFTLNAKRIEKVCDLIIENGWDIRWKCETRVDRVNSRLLSKMKSAGCELISYGVESGSQKILNILRKGITLNQVRKAFKATKKIGIDILAYFIIGSPSETWKTIKKTIDFAINLDPEFVQFSFATPFPGTDLFKLAVEKRIISENDYSSLMFFGKSARPIELSELNQEELQLAMKTAYKKFYLRPKYILKMMSKTRTSTQLKQRIRGMKSILEF